MQCYIFDIDGTLSDPTHRLHYIQQTPKDWDAFFGACGDDSAHQHVVELVQALIDAGSNIVFVSGRSDQCRVATRIWLDDVGIGQDLGESPTEWPLYMRKRGDHRSDDIVKGELLDQLLADGYEPIMAFDDRKRGVDMWRARGIPCAASCGRRFLMTPRRHPEADLQRTVVEMLQRFARDDVIWFHPANGEKRSKATAAKLKKMGVVAGVSDLVVVPWQGRVKWLELKVGKGRPSPAQLVFAARCTANGSDYTIARTPEQAAEALFEWGALKSHPFRRTK